MTPNDPDKTFNSSPNDAVNWPTECSEVNDTTIETTLNGRPEGPSDTTNVVGHMHLLGHRLGNGPLIEMMPDRTIIATQMGQDQPPDPTPQNPDPEKVGLQYPGCYGLTAGSRGGFPPFYRSCASGHRGDEPEDCYISRFGWIGDRASLDDQIANAALTEMNITSKQGYRWLNPNPQSARDLIRYKDRLCGPANKNCTGENGANLDEANSDLLEQEIRDMATYQRWIGIPNRSEYQVSSEMVQKGEKVFKDLKCHSCHVIDKVIYSGDNMLPPEERIRLQSLKNDQPDYPFISYLGTDLLLHDMGIYRK